MRAKPWEVPDGLWQRLEPLLPKRERRFRYPGRKPFDDRLALRDALEQARGHVGCSAHHPPGGSPASPLGGASDDGVPHDGASRSDRPAVGGSSRETGGVTDSPVVEDGGLAG